MAFTCHATDWLWIEVHQIPFAILLENMNSYNFFRYHQIWFGEVWWQKLKKKTNLRVPHFQFATIVIINASSSSSHFWQDMRFHALQKYADALLNICFFGTQYTKHTKMNWVGWRCGVYYLNINIHRYTLYTHESCQIEFGLSTFILAIK